MFPNDALVNYIYPNNADVVWSIMIVIYPYTTGLVAGAFVVSSLSHVFKIKEFKPIANFALVAAFCFGMFAAMPLLFHLGQPQRFYEIYVTPHVTSAMSGFGYIYSSYLVLLMIEIWLIYRPYFHKMAEQTQGKGLMGFIWKALTLWVPEYNPDSAKIDHRLIAFMAGIGIPWACLLHGYVGFVFGSVKAVAWWATALQPFIFLSSAMVSGMSVLLLLYVFIFWRRGVSVDMLMVRKYAAFLWAVFLIDYSLEVLELIFVSYENSHHWAIVRPLINGPLFESYFFAQMGVFSIVPLLSLGWVVLGNLKDKMVLWLTSMAALLLIFQVLVMRFNVVVGGQLISKSERGFVDYEWEFFAREGIFTALVILCAPFVLFYILSRFIPIFEDPAKALGPDQD